jgi:hypothetical protein
MMIGTRALKAYIRVAAIFQGGKVKPMWFGLDGKRYDVMEVCYTWELREGAASILHYSVCDGTDTYVLEYNTKNLTWSLRIAEAIPG